MNFRLYIRGKDFKLLLILSLTEFYRFITADSWRGVVGALRRFDRKYDSETPLDDYINLKDEVKPITSGWSLPTTRTIMYRNPPGAFETFKSGVHSNLRAAAAPFVPKNLQENVEEDVEEEDATADEELELHEPEGSEEAVTIENNFKPLAPPTEEEICAVVQIQKAYKSVRAKRDLELTPEDTARRFWYKECLDASTGFRRTYKVYFLGPLPHALLSIRAMANHAHTMKASARKKIKDTSDSELEEAGKQFSRMR